MSGPAQVSWLREAVEIVRGSPCCALLVVMTIGCGYAIYRVNECHAVQEEDRQLLRDLIKEELRSHRRRLYAPLP